MQASHPHLAVFWAPVLRVWETGLEVKLAAVVVGMANAILGDEIFLGLILCLVLVMAADWRYGRAAARRRGDFQEEVSTWGFRTKVAALIEVLFLRLMEYQVLQLPQLPDAWDYAFVSAAVGAGLLIAEFRSYDRHRRALGGAAIAGVSQALDLLQRLTDAAMPVEDTNQEPRP